MSTGVAQDGGPGAPDGAGPVVAPVRRMRWRPVRQPVPPAHTAPAIAGARIAVLGGTPPLAARVAARLRECGARVVTDPGPGGDWRVDGRLPDGLVDLTLAEPFDPERGGAHAPALLRTVAALRACYPEWERETATRRLFYLAVTYLGGGMGFAPEDHAPGAGPQPLGGIWAGLAKTLHREIPNCNTRILDTSLDETDLLPERICRELYRWGLFEIGHRGGHRFTLRAEAEDAGPPAVPLGPDDLVLVSGGGRGIGWLIATALARAHGCRVVVTGRGPLPDPAVAPWLTAGEADFAAYERGLWGLRAEGRPITAIRADIAAARRERELLAHLSGAHREGLRITYGTCDFTDPDAVGRLLDGLDGPPTAVIHNAGVDTPARFPKKTDEEFLRTVTTKTDGFLHLFQRVRALPLKFFCAVGSLTGRLGGMVGQLDYGAANEGLARLALWADRVAPFPVMTLCWPTWDRVGMVANFEATLRYMAALDVEEGVRLWLTELAAGTRGEVTYVGPFGRALGPLQALGYPGSEELPGYRALVPALFHLGDVSDHAPHRGLTARITLTRERVPVLTDFEVDGAPALPVSLLLENALWAAAWLPPEDLAPLVPDRFEDIRVRPAALRLDAGAAPLERTARAAYVDGAWHVEVVYRTGAALPREAARLRVVHRAADGPRAVPGAGPGGAVPEGAPARRGGEGAPRGLRWRGRVLPLASWQDTAGALVAARLTEAPANDVWMLPRWPEQSLPLTALENLLRRTPADGPGGPPELRVRRISLLRPPGTARMSGARLLVEGDPRRGDWLVSDEASGAHVLRVHAASYRGDAP
ncbi:KR domain-containing protein [Streptomyces sp. NPDC052077]|uniref:KR domain-containing protein n=1 Tax=Streptomyces sp. NPDC052077 TaxID=3154757 RepID=UPI00341EFE2A